jgi:hypothetical protein
MFVCANWLDVAVLTALSKSVVKPDTDVVWLGYGFLDDDARSEVDSVERFEEANSVWSFREGDRRDEEGVFDLDACGNLSFEFPLES